MKFIYLKKLEDQAWRLVFCLKRKYENVSSLNKEQQFKLMMAIDHANDRYLRRRKLLVS